MPQSIPKGLTRDHVLRAIADLDAGIEHPFGKPTGYELVHADKRYAPKGVPARSRPVPPGSEFYGGDPSVYIGCFTD